jgi:hypothetical protein
MAPLRSIAEECSAKTNSADPGEMTRPRPHRVRQTLSRVVALLPHPLNPWFGEFSLPGSEHQETVTILCSLRLATVKSGLTAMGELTNGFSVTDRRSVMQGSPCDDWPEMVRSRVGRTLT